MRSTEWGRPPGYGSDDTVWATTGTEPSNVEFRSDDGIVLQVTQLPDLSWLVVGGERCTG